MRVGEKFRAVLATEYEQRHPGRLARMGYKLKKIKTSKGIKEVVLVPKNRENEWDVTLEEIQGVHHREVFDNGDMKLRERQAAAKFNSLAQAARQAYSNDGTGPQVDDEESNDAEEPAPEEGDGESHTDASDCPADDDDLESGARSSALLMGVGDNGSASSSLAAAATPAPDAKPRSKKVIQFCKNVSVELV